MEKLCSICKVAVDSDDAPILAMGGFGNPRYLCKSCEQHLDGVTLGKNYDDIKKSMEILGERMTSSNIDDELTFDTMESIFESAKDRAERIKDGTYDFSCEDSNDEIVDDVPDDLKETEEDCRLDAEDEEEQKKQFERSRKFDKLFFYPLLGGMLIGMIAYIIIKKFL